MTPLPSVERLREVRNPVSKWRGRDWHQRLAAASAVPGIARHSEHYGLSQSKLQRNQINNALHGSRRQRGLEIENWFTAAP